MMVKYSFIWIDTIERLIKKNKARPWAEEIITKWPGSARYVWNKITIIYNYDVLHTAKATQLQYIRTIVALIINTFSIPG